MEEIDWQQVEKLFHQAAELPLVMRDHFLAELDPEMRRIVTELLSVDSIDGDAGGAEAALFGTVEHAAALFSRPAGQVGHWKLVRPLGEGGMGSVYLAVRSDGTFDRKVAIKFVRRGMDSPTLRLRLESERRILARLDHPNIARLLDAGATPEGQPYLVMEYVEGESILTYAEKQSLTIPQKLELFLEVCDAVEYAHRNLVVHRDLKPANILVDASGTARLLDFGIAKLVDPGTSPSGVTQLRIMSFEWASPEQIRGESATTATDIYSLGAVLYEVLSGELPFRVEGLSPLEAEQLISRTEPPRPSTRIPALRRQLSGDLDNIILKALRHNPAERFPSVSHLAADLRRHLAGEAIEARDYTAAERVSLFIRRHRVPVAAAAVALLGLVFGAGIAVIYAVQAHKDRAVAVAERTRAESERERAQAQSDEAARQARLAESKETDAQFQRSAAELERGRAERTLHNEQQVLQEVVDSVYTAMVLLPGATEARLSALQSSIPPLEALHRDQPQNASVANLLARAYQRMGELYNGNSAGKSNPEKAFEYFGKSLVIMEQLTKRDPQNVDYLVGRGLLEGQTATLLADNSGNDAESRRKVLNLFAASIADSRKALRLKPGQGDIANRLADALSARLISTSRDPDPGYAVDLKEFRALCEADLRATPNDVDALDRAGRMEAAEAFYQLSRNDLKASLQAEERSLEYRERAVAIQPRNTPILRGIIVSSSRIADGYRRLEGLTSPKIAAAYERMTKMAEQLAAIDPADQTARYDVAMTQQRLGAWYADTGRGSAAIAPAERSVQVFRELKKEKALTTTRLRNFVYAIYSLGRAYEVAGRTGDAVRAWQDSLSECEVLIAADPKDVSFLSTASRDLLRLAHYDAAKGADLSKKAVLYAERMLEINPAAAQQAWLARARGTAALVLSDAGQNADAAGFARLAAEALGHLPAPLLADWPPEERARFQALAEKLGAAPRAGLN